MRENVCFSRRFIVFIYFEGRVCRVVHGSENKSSRLISFWKSSGYVSKVRK